MRTISLITPSGRSRPDLWEPAARSVLKAREALPDGWSLQWCIHADGVDPGLWRAQSFWRGVADIATLTASPRSGFARARNAALSQATGELLGALDDDELGPGWPLLLAALADAPELGWAAGATLDIDLQGGALPSPPLRPGRIEPGECYDELLLTKQWPWHGCAVLSRTHLVRDLGGWDELPWCEDVSLFAALTERSPGVQIPDVVYHLRQHPERATHTLTRLEGLEVGSRAVHERVRSIRSPS